MNIRALIVGSAVALTLVAAGHAEVLETTANGFAVRETVHVAATPDQVYDALLHPAKWWNGQHTFSGNAANLTLDVKAGGCLCESLPHGGSALHLTVVDVEPGSILRFRGPMGPFQGEGVESALTFTLKAEAGGTLLTLDNKMGGTMQGGFAKCSAASDGMLGGLVARLKTYAETGKGN
ncbi:MAG TPA: SRPBCC domain-containing protein [Rhizomicrobium sp.]